MNPKQASTDSKALVTVFDSVEVAKQAVEKLHEAGFSTEKIELVTRNIETQAPEVTTPKVHETTANSMVDSAAKWSGVGAATGLLAAVFAPFPGVGLAMIFMGGLTGAVVGGMAGLDDAKDDDSVDLPTLKEYDELVQNGDSLVVVLGSHDEVKRAEEIVKRNWDLVSHLHKYHGHEFHEHPSKE